MSEKKTVLSRRNFLLTMGAGGATAAAALVGQQAAPDGAVAKDDKRATQGYRQTAHVDNYYRTAKV